MLMLDIADQIERERACDEDAIENVRLIVGRVIDDMERHVSGVEGADDSPVARWARELRRALKSDTSDGRDAQNPSWHDPAETADVSSEAAKVTRDPAADVSMSAYDLLPADEREAIAWVRDHGGLKEVEKEWNARSNLKRSLKTAQAKVERQQRHIELVQGKYKARVHRIVELHKTIAEMRPRLMPEGMEWLVEAWPRFEDDSPVRLLDDFERYGDENGVSVVTMYSDGSFALNFRAYSKGERVNRPAPKVLDADGVEIRVGDTVYQMGCKYRVSHLHGANDYVRIVYENSGRWVDPKTLTHQRPVIAADGRPLEVGQTVWDTNGDELVIGALEDGGHTVTCRYVDVGDAIPVHGMWSPSDLTHERPDSWERLEEDARSCTCVMEAIDLVRRCRALAERERGRITDGKAVDE